MARVSLSLLAVGLAGFAQAQQPAPARVTTPLIVSLLPYVEDENFGKELQLKPEQVKTFVEFRKKQWDEQYTTAPSEYRKGSADRTKATVALFKDTLTADQHKRAVQLAAQNAWGSLGLGRRGAAVLPADATKAPASALRDYTELADALNLTDEQKKLVAAAQDGGFGRTAVTVFLMAEQSKAAREFLGEPVKAGWTTAFDERQNRFFGSMLQSLYLTQAKDVRTEIAMTDEQVKALAPLLTKWQALTGPGGGGRPANLSPEAQAKRNDELTAETDKALAATLKPEQLTRLRQIEQQQIGGFGGPLGATMTTPLSARLRTLVIRKALGVTDDQSKALAGADKATGDAIAAAVTADGSVDDAIKTITAVHDAHEKAYAAVLTADQTKKLDEMLGKPFTGSTRSDRAPPGIDPDQLKQIRTANFGQRILVELTLLAQNPAIRDDLKLSPEQVKKAADAATEYRTKFIMPFNPDAPPLTPEERAKRTAEVSGFIAKAVEGILTAEQGKRYRELMLQRAEFFLNQNQGGFNTNVGAVGYPGVAEAVKLTAEQKKKLLDDGAKPDEVLTADQKTAIKDMLGKKFEGDFQTKGGGGGPGGRPTATTLTVASVLLNVNWDVFKITPEQAAKLVPVANEYQLATMPTPGGGPGGRVPPAKLAAANEKVAKALAVVLTPEQVKRVEQVRYQLVAAAGRTTYLTNAEVAKALALKDEQKAKIAAVLADSQRLQSAALGTSPFNPFGGGGGSWSQKLGEKTNAKAMAVLTDEQKATWKALTGDPVPNLRPLNQFGGMGGGRGPGGGGGFIGGGPGGGF